jgi:hypothetical protein
MVTRSKKSRTGRARQPDTFDKLTKTRNSAFKRFPLIFSLLGTFGLVSTLYGVQHIFDKIPLLANDPLLSLGVGIGILFLTGTLYKKLG